MLLDMLQSLMDCVFMVGVSTESFIAVRVVSIIFRERVMKIRKILCGVALVSLAACSNDVKPIAGEPYVSDAGLQSEISQQLAESASRSANALETLSMEMRARTAPAKSSVDESQLPPELSRHITTVWNGPAYELVKRIARDMGYNYIETGNPSANPGYVSIDAHDLAVAKILEDIGYQAQAYATIIVNPNLKRIEYRVESGASRALSSAVSHGRRRVISHRHVAVRTSASTTKCKPCETSFAKPSDSNAGPMPFDGGPHAPPPVGDKMPPNMVPVNQ